GCSLGICHIIREPSVAVLGLLLHVPNLCTTLLMFPLLVSVPSPRLCPGQLSQHCSCIRRYQEHSRTTASQRLSRAVVKR
ncbi:hypothetical protein J6590_107469, partial [Homalodisca vitripennis]